MCIYIYIYKDDYEIFMNNNRDSSLEYYEDEPKNEPNYEIILAYEFGDPI